MTTFLASIVIFLMFTPAVLVFPTHDDSEDRMVNPRFDPRDDKACGLFRPSDDGRVFRGNTSYSGQFPWAVCFHHGFGVHVRHFNDGRKERTRGFNETIFDFGPYEFSTVKGTIYLDQVHGWMQFCTGSIINEHWIITAGHCMLGSWEGNYFYIQAGSNNCLTPTYNRFTREVVVNRIQNNEHQSIFEHPNWITSRGKTSALKQVAGYDLALVRLDEPYILPKGVYNNELVNRICIHSYIDFPKTGCLKNVYFSGFGRKDNSVDRRTNDPTARLTWFKSFRTSPQFCKTITNTDYYSVKTACYSPVNRYADLGNDPSMKEVGSTNLTEVEMHPNTCTGDSGGPFVYYMRYDKKSADKYNVLSDGSIQTGYRAILLSTAMGNNARERQKGPCEQNFWVGSKSLFKSVFHISSPEIYYKPVTLGPMMHDRVLESFFTSTLASSARGYSKIGGEHIKYPDRSLGYGR